MRLRPRHYILLLLLVALAAFNALRWYRDHHAASPQARRGTSPAWAAFDRAAALRDASEADFAPALTALNTAIDSSNAVPVPPQTGPSEASDLHGCQTWLLFYRQNILHPSAKPDFLNQTREHVLACTHNHRDSLV